jgi:hypothetical protein
MGESYAKDCRWLSNAKKRAVPGAGSQCCSSDCGGENSASGSHPSSLAYTKSFYTVTPIPPDDAPVVPYSLSQIFIHFRSPLDAHTDRFAHLPTARLARSALCSQLLPPVCARTRHRLPVFRLAHTTSPAPRIKKEPVHRPRPPPGPPRSPPRPLRVFDPPLLPC